MVRRRDIPDAQTDPPPTTAHLGGGRPRPPLLLRNVLKDNCVYLCLSVLGLHCCVAFALAVLDGFSSALGCVGSGGCTPWVHRLSSWGTWLSRPEPCGIFPEQD